MVKCRSQKDINEGVTAAAAAAGERAFFGAHPFFTPAAALAAGAAGEAAACFGAAALAAKLSRVLAQRIQASLPALKYDLVRRLEETVSRLGPLGAAPGTASERRLAVTHLVADYSSLLRQSARGLYCDPRLAADASLRLHGAQQRAFVALQAAVAATAPDFDAPAVRAALQKEAAAVRGREVAGLASSQAFYVFVAQAVERWRPLVERCRAAHVAAVSEAARKVAAAACARFPALAGVLVADFQSIAEGYEPKVRRGEEKEAPRLSPLSRPSHRSPTASTTSSRRRPTRTRPTRASRSSSTLSASNGSTALSRRACRRSARPTWPTWTSCASR